MYYKYIHYPMSIRGYGKVSCCDCGLFLLKTLNYMFVQ